MRFRLRRFCLHTTAFVVFGALPMFAGSITYTCDANLGSFGPSGLCSYLNTTIAGLYSSTFTNATADIYIQYGSTGLGESEQDLGIVSYSQYFTALSDESTDAEALASLSATEPSIYDGGGIVLTTALAQALGFTDNFGITPSGSSCTLGSPNCYYGVITITESQPLWYRGLSGGSQPGNAYDYFSVVEHETDEILGTASCIETTTGSLVDYCGGTNASAVDLFRYSAPGTRVFESTTPGAYFSPNGGVTDTDGNTYNTLANGDDYADFSSTCAFVQDAVGCPGGSFNVTTDGPGGTPGPEGAILNAVGFDENPATTPEPASMVLLGSGMLVLAGRRRKKS